VVSILPGSSSDSARILPGTKKNVPGSIRARWKQDGSTMKQEQDESTMKQEQDGSTMKQKQDGSTMKQKQDVSGIFRFF